MTQIATAQATQALLTVPYFAQLSESEAQELSRSLVPRHFSNGQIIFHLGDPGGLLYIIQTGKVKITRSTPEGQEAQLAIMGAGDFFGGMALLDNSPRSATAQAIEPTTALTLHRDEFVRYIRSNPDFAMQVLSVLCRRVRHLNDQVADIFFLDLPARLARTLLHLAENHGEKSPEGIQISLSLTQTDLAEMTGATRVSINKALKRFRKAGWVEVKGRRVTVVDGPALDNLILVSGG